jgi:hypothetical protein
MQFYCIRKGEKKSTVTIELIIGGVIESSFFMSCQQYCGIAELNYCLYEYTRLTFGTLVFHLAYYSVHN